MRAFREFTIIVIIYLLALICKSDLKHFRSGSRAHHLTCIVTCSPASFLESPPGLVLYLCDFQRSKEAHKRLRTLALGQKSTCDLWTHTPGVTPVPRFFLVIAHGSLTGPEEKSMANLLLKQICRVIQDDVLWALLGLHVTAADKVSIPFRPPDGPACQQICGPHSARPPVAR